MRAGAAGLSLGLLIGPGSGGPARRQDTKERPEEGADEGGSDDGGRYQSTDGDDQIDQVHGCHVFRLDTHTDDRPKSDLDPPNEEFGEVALEPDEVAGRHTPGR